MPNPERTNAVISAVIAILAAGLFFLPGWIGMDGMRGGYAISFVAIFIAISAALVTLFFWRRAKALDTILTGKEVLAHWKYQPGEWQSYRQVELKEQTNQNKWLLAVMAAWALFFGGLCWAFDRNAGGTVFLFMLGMILILAAVAFGLPRWRYWRQSRGPGEAWITPNAVFFDGVLVHWPTWGAQLENVAWREAKGKTPALIEFELSYPSRAGAQSHTMRVPVPAGREAEARDIVEKFES